MMTFSEFQASKRWSSDLGRDVPDYASYAEDKTVCGFVYAGSLVIELVTDAQDEYAKENGKYMLVLGNCDYLEFELPKLEQMLYEYALAERFVR